MYTIFLFKTIYSIKVIESLISTKENLAILKKSALSHLEDVTICARFNTYQFSLTDKDDPHQFLVSNSKNFVVLGSFSAFNCNKRSYLGSECTTYFKGELGERWRYGATYGNIYLGPSVQQICFPTWKPKRFMISCTLYCQ